MSTVSTDPRPTYVDRIQELVDTLRTSGLGSSTVLIIIVGVAIDDSGCGGIHCGCGLSWSLLWEVILYSSCSFGGIVAGRSSEVVASRRF